MNFCINISVAYAFFTICTYRFNLKFDRHAKSKKSFTIGLYMHVISTLSSISFILWLYRGLVEGCYANENLLDPSLELLSSHLASLPPISRDAYVESTKTSTVILEPLPQLVQVASQMFNSVFPCTNYLSYFSV